MTDLLQITKTWYRPKEKNDKTINIKCTIKQYEELQFAAKKLHITKSDLVRYAISEFLCKHL